MIGWAFNLYLLCSLIGMAAAATRLWFGPTIADRLNAADFIAITAIAMLLASGVLNAEGIVVDVALAAAIVLFFGTAVGVQFLSVTMPKPKGGGDHA